MKKIIALVVVMLLPLGAFAQSGAKIACVKANEVYMAMPELEAAMKKLEALNEEYMVELKGMQEDAQNKYQAFMAQQDSLSENIKMRRMQEIEQINARSEELYQFAQQDIQKKQGELLAPVNQKLQKAISDVGAEKGFTYIIDVANLIYVGADAEDITPLVKAKLGLK
ncbi:outer membrane protein [Parabacteroides sp. PFB2-12]|uniref:OmpH family outer membrane protein n=1 Tax=unclassified Parabacteroides TaxID=2649774 RepID=UPI0024737741|nr:MULTISPECIES: OmpH family outer membrane protein [unclassified Parabacteroides]MDH6343214.1 outer membrane protein [Parabacteroides sp. PM6-13]MDH6392132.1 outer membrane protein [Parabacteroides sp. PFB2-12]